jgi:two-component system, NarL family, nitrate/nitrite response regulator NarL
VLRGQPSKSLRRKRSRLRAGPDVTRVVVAADVGFYREGLAFVLPRYGFDVVGTAATGHDAVAATVALAPDVTLLDMAMSSSLGVLQAIAQHAPRVARVALGVSDEERAVLGCIEAGATAYVTRDATLADVVATIRRAIRGESLASPRIVGILMRRAALAAQRSDPPPVESLTAREIEVIRLIDEGLSNRAIAARLCIEVTTVKNHVHNILDKLGARRRGEIGVRLPLAPAPAAYPGRSRSSASVGARGSGPSD